MLSVSLGISFSGLLHCMLDYFADLMNQHRASDLFETRSFNSVKLLREVLPGKEIEHASSEMGLGPEFKNFKAASSSSKNATKCNQSRLKTDVSIMDKKYLLPSFRNEGASSSSDQALNQSGAIISNPRKMVCNNYCKGKVVLQASEAEDLNARLKNLEEESEIMKEAFLETVVERRELIDEICQLFETLNYAILNKDKEEGHVSGYESLIINASKVLHIEPLV